MKGRCLSECVFIFPQEPHASVCFCAPLWWRNQHSEFIWEFVFICTYLEWHVHLILPKFYISAVTWPGYLKNLSSGTFLSENLSVVFKLTKLFPLSGLKRNSWLLQLSTTSICFDVQSCES